jgi:hypothetical protein
VQERAGVQEFNGGGYKKPFTFSLNV